VVVFLTTRSATFRFHDEANLSRIFSNSHGLWYLWFDATAVERSMALPPLTSDAELLASLGTDLQGQTPSLRQRLSGFSIDPIPDDDDAEDEYHGGLAAVRTLGPFQDTLGRIVVVDVYVETSVVPIQFTG
jgi:hypothetical protein